MCLPGPEGYGASAAGWWAAGSLQPDPSPRSLDAGICAPPTGRVSRHCSGPAPPPQSHPAPPAPPAPSWCPSQAAPATAPPPVAPCPWLSHSASIPHQVWEGTALRTIGTETNCFDPGEENGFIKASSPGCRSPSWGPSLGHSAWVKAPLYLCCQPGPHPPACRVAPQGGSRT